MISSASSSSPRCPLQTRSMVDIPKEGQGRHHHPLCEEGVHCLLWVDKYTDGSLPRLIRPQTGKPAGRVSKQRGHLSFQSLLPLEISHLDTTL
ncbi:hypothetical protein AGIG_G4177 [Arapaima gigas]